MKNLNSDKSYIEKGGILFGTKKDRYYINGSDTHTLVIGATRSGKSRSIVLPTIGIEGLAGENMVVSDPKGELHQYTYPFLEALGYLFLILKILTVPTILIFCKKLLTQLMMIIFR